MEDTACCSNTNGCNENSEPQWRTTVGNGRKFNRKDATVFDEFLAQDEIKRIVNSCTTTYMPLKRRIQQIAVQTVVGDRISETQWRTAIANGGNAMAYGDSKRRKRNLNICSGVLFIFCGR